MTLKYRSEGRWSPDPEQFPNCTVYDGWRKVKNYRRDELGRFVRNNDDRHAELRRHLFDCIICAVAGGLIVLVLIRPD